MNGEFRQILLDHAARYPHMTPQDWGKLAYQSEFGPEHLVSATPDIISYLLAEWQSAQGSTIAPQPEPIGNGLCRLHLDDSYEPTEAAPLLAELFSRTAREHSGSPEGLKSRLEQISRLGLPGWPEWLAEYAARGYPSLRHSPQFREEYLPHYRVVAADYANYFPALLAIDRLTRLDRPVIVSIDGRCGSGKTALADLIRRLFPCNVFHMDHYYLPLDYRAHNWTELPAGNMDLRRFRDEVLRPIRAGAPVPYQPYSCQHGSLQELTWISPCRLNIVEGSCCQHPELASYYDLKIFLTCGQAVQTARLQAREGDYFPMFQNRWIPMEERYLRAFSIEKNCDLTFDTSTFF